MIPLPGPEETRDAGVPAVEVVLADGNAWGLALPGPRLHPITETQVDPFGRPQTRVGLVTRVGYPIGIWRLWDAVRAASEGGESGLRDAVRGLAVALLRMAHEIDEEEAEALLDPRRVDIEGIAEIFIPAAFGSAGANRPGGR